MATINSPGLPIFFATSKRTFDLLFATLGLLLTWWLILAGWAAASIDTQQNGFFIQERVGRGGKVFRVVKLRTMRSITGLNTTVTQAGDARITRIGRLLRKFKIDELPQLWNVLKGDMSFVGPRPDVPGFADRLAGSDRDILSLRPGITGPATLKYRHEEEMLANVEDPETYNREVIWPDKVRINREYLRKWRFRNDLKYIWWTITGKSV